MEIYYLHTRGIIMKKLKVVLIGAGARGTGSRM